MQRYAFSLEKRKKEKKQDNNLLHLNFQPSLLACTVIASLRRNFRSQYQFQSGSERHWLKKPSL